MATNFAQQLINYGQSVWYDNISRDILLSGEMVRLIKECGVRGLTSNPTIFNNALSKGIAYDGQINALRFRNLSTDQVFEELALQDIAAAADLLLPVYQESKAEDGYVSIEVSPLLAQDTKRTVEEAVRIFGLLSRPNIMIKIPGTAEGIPAVQQVLEQGVNVNATLLFSVENYVQVAKAYCAALRSRAAKGLPVDRVRSVASFFVSRVDTIIDKRLEEIVKETDSTKPATAQLAQTLFGKFGVANSKLAYAEFQKIFTADQFADLKKAGAAVQRPLWASTSMKNPKYRDVYYVEELIGAHTVNTMPPVTLEAFIDHGRLAETVTKGVAEAQSLAQQLTDIGVDISKLLNFLQVDGVEKFSDSFRALNATIEKKLTS